MPFKKKAPPIVEKGADEFAIAVETAVQDDLEDTIKDGGGPIRMETPPGWPKNEPDEVPRRHGDFAKEQLVHLVERVERLEEEKAALVEDIKEVYTEGKGAGFDTSIIRKVISLRKMDQASRLENAAVLELYMQALGMALC